MSEWILCFFVVLSFVFLTPWLSFNTFVIFQPLDFVCVPPLCSLSCVSCSWFLCSCCFLFYFRVSHIQCFEVFFLFVSSGLIRFSCVSFLLWISIVPLCVFIVCASHHWIFCSSVFSCLSFLIPDLQLLHCFLRSFWIASISSGFVSVFQFPFAYCVVDFSYSHK